MRRPRSSRGPAFSILTAVARPSGPRTTHTSPRRPLQESQPKAPIRRSYTESPPSPSPALESDGIRVNKCFKSFASRRQSDGFIADQRVTINDRIAAPGARVRSGDIVSLDGKVIDWERLNLDESMDSFVYIKHWKSPGVVCTTSPEEPNNILSQIEIDSKDRIFPIGRLDEASTGLILLTSDGRLPNAVLGAGKSCLKEYLVVPDMYVTDEHIQAMREGVPITTVTSRDYGRKTLSAPTLPCRVERGDGLQLLISLQEGRNRQIRKMMGVLGYTTRAIHRIAFMGIGLDGLERPGDSCRLNDKELALVEKKLKQANP